MASLAAFEADENRRRFGEIRETLPEMVRPLVTHYLGLFRAGDRGLSFPRAVRLMTDLAGLLSTGTIDWDGRQARPIYPDQWARAIEIVLGRRPANLANHNYLRHVAWDLVEKDEREEIRRSDSGSKPAPRSKADEDRSGGHNDDPNRRMAPRPAPYADTTMSQEQIEKNKARARELREKLAASSTMGPPTTRGGDD
jgi:hypothetical protein